MDMDLQSLTNLGVWLVQILYFFGPLVLVVINYLKKTTGMISSFMVYGYFFAYLFDLFYFYSGDFPLPYKVKVPLALIVVSVLIYQQFHYSYRRPLNGLFKVLGVAGLLSIGALFSIFQLNLSFQIFGWLSAAVWSVYQLPQILKIFINKSASGFSIIFVIVMALGVLLDLSVGLVLHMPLPTILTSVRAFVFYVILGIECVVYKS